VSRKSYFGIAVIMAIAIFDVIVYKYQSTNNSGGIPVCYPSGKIKYDSVYNSKFRLVNPK
jgi:hypothetical protein